MGGGGGGWYKNKHFHNQGSPFYHENYGSTQLNLIANHINSIFTGKFFCLFVCFFQGSSLCGSKVFKDSPFLHQVPLTSVCGQSIRKWIVPFSSDHWNLPVFRVEYLAYSVATVEWQIFRDTENTGNSQKLNTKWKTQQIMENNIFVSQILKISLKIMIFRIF